MTVYKLLWVSRTESWDIMRSLAGYSTLPWCILGDFNGIMFAEEKRGGRTTIKSVNGVYRGD